MRSHIALAFLLPLAAHAQQQAQFCVVTSYGQMDCSHTSLQSCQRSASYSRGQCVISAQAQKPCNGVNFGGGYCSESNPGQAFTDAYNNAARQRQQKELHEAQLEVLRAQAEAARSRTEQRNDWAAILGAAKAKLDQPKPITYICPAPNGSYYRTTGSPQPGCVVE